MEELKYCPYCGTSLPKQAMFCRKCGKPYENKDDNSKADILGANEPINSSFRIQEKPNETKDVPKVDKRKKDKADTAKYKDKQNNTAIATEDSTEVNNAKGSKKKKKTKWWLIALIGVAAIIIAIIVFGGGSRADIVLSDHLGDSREGVEKVISDLSLKEFSDNIYQGEGLTLAINENGNISELCITSPNYPFYDIRVGDSFDILKDGDKLTSHGYAFVSENDNEISYEMRSNVSRRIILVLDNGIVKEIDYLSMDPNLAEIELNVETSADDNSISKEESIQALTDYGRYYGYNTILANWINGMLNDSEIENKTILDNGIKYIDNHNDYFPVYDPGYDYYDNVNFEIQKRNILKYPEKEYGLMHVAGCISSIKYYENDEDIKRLIGTDGITEFTLYGYCDSSNSYETFSVLYNGDIPFAYEGTPVVVIGTPIATYNDDAICIMASMVVACDSNLDGKIVYGKTESESAMEIIYGSWANLYMSEEKLKEETVRLGKEKLGFDANSTDEDIPVSMFKGSWTSADDVSNRTYILINLFDKQLEDYEELLENAGERYRDIVEKYRAIKGQYEYVVTIDDVDYFGNLEGKSIVFSNELGSGTVKMSFSKAAQPIETLAKDWLSDKTKSKDGVYLHYSSNDNSLSSSGSDFEGTWYYQNGGCVTIAKDGNQYVLITDYGDYPCELQDGVLVSENITISFSDEPIQTELATPLAKNWVGEGDNRVSSNGQYIIVCYAED